MKLRKVRETTGYVFRGHDDSDPERDFRIGEVIEVEGDASWLLSIGFESVDEQSVTDSEVTAGRKKRG